jgi:hypothetical protein
MDQVAKAVELRAKRQTSIERNLIGKTEVVIHPK